MTALVVVPAVKVRHGGPNISHGLPVLAEGELVFVGPVEAFEDPSPSQRNQQVGESRSCAHRVCRLRRKLYSNQDF